MRPPVCQHLFEMFFRRSFSPPPTNPTVRPFSWPSVADSLFILPHPSTLVNAFFTSFLQESKLFWPLIRKVKSSPVTCPIWGPFLYYMDNCIALLLPVVLFFAILAPIRSRVWPLSSLYLEFPIYRKKWSRAHQYTRFTASGTDAHLRKHFHHVAGASLFAGYTSP